MGIRREMKIKKFQFINNALIEYKLITGSGFFDGYENCKASTTACAERDRQGDWMVSEDGSVYFLTLCPDEGLKCLNKLSLCSCMDDSSFYEVRISDMHIMVLDQPYSRSKESRQRLSQNRMIVTT